MKTSLSKTDKAKRDREMLERFKLWLSHDGYSPRPVNIPHPAGVSIGHDGLIVPTLSADCPMFLFGREFQRGMHTVC